MSVYNTTFRRLEGIKSGSNGESLFSEAKTYEQAQSEIDAFKETNKVTINDVGSTLGALDFETDIMIFRVNEQVNAAPFYSIETSAGSAYETFFFLEYNYNMSTASVDATLDRFLNNITEELRPPKNSKTFIYDFKFARNRNGSITTGSVSSRSSRSTTTSGGGGY